MPIDETATTASSMTQDDISTHYEVDQLIDSSSENTSPSDEELEEKYEDSEKDLALGDVLELLEKSLGRRLEDQRSMVPTSTSPSTSHRPTSSKMSGSPLISPKLFPEFSLFRTISQHQYSQQQGSTSELHSIPDYETRDARGINERDDRRLEDKDDDASSTDDDGAKEKFSLQDFLSASERKLPPKKTNRKKSGKRLFSKIFSIPIDHEKHPQEEDDHRRG